MMLSFLKQLRTEDTTHKVDLSTSGESAYVYTGGHQTQIPKDTTRIRIDRSAKHLDGRVSYGNIFSMEVPDLVLKMDVNLTQGTSCLGPSKVVQAMQTMVASYKAQDVFKSEGMRCLRNVAFPQELSDKDLPTFDTANTDLGKVLPAKRNPEYIYRMFCNGYALRNRFEGLPLHRACYYHSHDSEEVAIQNLSRELDDQSGMLLDCLGMTPLHILACSTKQYLEMYQILIRRYPGYLITKDVWGDLPLLYALWGRVPLEVVQFLAKSMKEYHETYLIDWEKMLETFCIGLAPIACVEYLIETNRSVFQRQKLQDVDWNNMVRLLCTKGKASEEHVHQFISLYCDAFPGGKLDLEVVSLELARKEKFGFKPFWLRISISERLSLLDKEEWLVEFESLIETCPTGSSERIVRERFELMKKILNKLAMYETVAQMWVLELALWKAKIGGSAANISQSKSCRSHCQVTCGADVIVPNVMEYLVERI